MNKHGARSRKIFRTFVAVAFVGVFALAGMFHSGVSAAPWYQTLFLNQGTLVTAEDGASKGDCRLTVVSVNESAGTVYARLNANIRPKGLGAFNTNQHVFQNCWVAPRSQQAPVLANAVVDSWGPKGSNIQYVTIPFLVPGYAVCTQIATVLESGSTVASGVVCKNTVP